MTTFNEGLADAAEAILGKASVATYRDILDKHANGAAMPISVYTEVQRSLPLIVTKLEERGLVVHLVSDYYFRHKAEALTEYMKRNGETNVDKARVVLSLPIGRGKRAAAIRRVNVCDDPYYLAWLDQQRRRNAGSAEKLRGRVVEAQRCDLLSSDAMRELVPEQLPLLLTDGK